MLQEIGAMYFAQVLQRFFGRLIELSCGNILLTVSGLHFSEKGAPPFRMTNV